jgi:hypothetical protein
MGLPDPITSWKEEPKFCNKKHDNMLTTGRLQQEIRRNGGRRLGRPWPENGLKRHRRRGIC